MFKTIMVIILSFFAVIGFFECILSMLETISTARYKNIKNLSLVVDLTGHIDDISFLLNTLMLQAERITYKNLETRVVVRDLGLDEFTYQQIHTFCLENENISVEKPRDM